MKNELQKNWMADDEYEYYSNSTFCEEISLDSEIAAKILKNWAKMATI